MRTLKTVILGLTLIFFACTDYVGQIDERIEEYDAFQKVREESLNSTTDYRVESSSVFFGELEDSRDGQTYRTVTIGSQTWMAENLNYEIAGSYCYNDVDSNCAMYGRLYTWAAAMDSAGIWAPNGSGCGKGKMCIPKYPVMGVCPDGWHLPSKGEWLTLVYAGVFSGWDQEGDDYGFRILLGGIRVYGEGFDYEGSQAFFWSSTDSDRQSAEIFWLSSETLGIMGISDKESGLSVRCVKDVVDEAPVVSSSSKNTSSDSSEKTGSDGLLSSSVAPGDSKTSSSSADTRETFVDERDGKVYKVTVIGTKRWMAQNLNFETERSSCYNDSAANCDTYGRLYPWADAIDSIGVYSESGIGCGYGVECSLPSRVRGICPENWHLPSQNEWKSLFELAGNKSSRLATPTGFGFEALAAGYRMSDTTYYHLGSRARFWSSEEVTRKLAYYAFIENDVPQINSVDKYYGFSIRCVQDDEVSGLVSSSSMGSSSSGKASWSYLDSKISYGEMTDARNGLVYKTVEIGTQIWMAENLNIGVEVPDWRDMNDDSQIERYCFGNKVDNCAFYGGLYTWVEAMNLPSHCNTEICTDLIQLQHQGICPEGWHLPTSTEFEALIEFAGGEEIAGRMLKSRKGWAEIGNGWDDFGFSALPNGENDTKDCSGGSGSGGCSAGFWSTTIGQDNSESEHPEYWGAYGMNLSANSDKAFLIRIPQNYSYETNSLSIRWVV